MKGQGVKLGVSLDEIDVTLKPASLMRANLNDEAIETYASTFDQLPPVKLMVDPDDGHHWVVDGAHTISAARKLGRKDIQAFVEHGTFLDAFKKAAHSNIEHGVRISHADKRHRVQIALENPVMRSWSNRLIAETCGVHHQIVGCLRPDVQVDESSTSKRIGKDGKSQSATKSKKPRGEPHNCDLCGEEFNSPVWHCNACSGHHSPGEPTCPNGHKSDVTFGESSEAKSEIDAAFPARDGDGWQDNPTLVVEPQREPLPNQAMFDFHEFWKPVSNYLHGQFKKCPADYHQDFADAVERSYQEFLHMTPGATRFELEEAIDE